MGAADDLDQLVQPGQILAGKYRIDRIIGRGGMGVVVAAHHMQLDEHVAIKFLLPAAVGRPDLLARFEREARAAVKIKSEHVARVIDVGVLDTGSPYMVMEFLEGVDLAQRLAAEGPLSAHQTADFVLQACEAIAEAHALGIVHRDLKPANLFVTRFADGLESVKVLDFGISKSSAMSGSAGSDMTQTQSMLGSPFYMSPEQMQSARSVDMRTDIWSLGCILYQCVTGLVPFEADTLPELVLKIVQSAPPPLQQVRPDVPPAFEQVIQRCLQKQRDHRYPHVGELASGLLPFAPERSRASAERIWRVMQTSGIASGAQPQLPASAPNLQAAKLATHKLTAPPADASATGPNLFDSRPSQGGATVGMGPPLTAPPPGTIPPGQASTGSHPGGFGVTSGTWGNTNAGKKTSGATALVAVFGGLFVIGAIGGGLFVAGRHFLGSASGVADAAPSASVAVTAAPSATTPSATPSSVLSVASAEPEPVVDAGLVVAIVDAAPPPPIATQHVTPTPAPAPAAKPGCTPPYYYDKDNNRVFKKECL
jgi:serine/threonine-protein kinase